MKTAVPDLKPQSRQYVKLEDLRPDPDQPRKVFDKTTLEALAANIKQVGIICDLIVEHRPAVRVDSPDLVSKEWRAVEEGGAKRLLLTGDERMVKDFAKGKDQAWFQIVDGERRWKAAMLAGLKEVPVIVRVIDEKMRLALQVVVNQQREALNALEEAAAYRKEIESGRHTAESLYKTLGISRGTLFARLALNRLHPPVRAALEQGKISVSVAGLVTMVPGLKAQEKLITKLTTEDWQYPWSFRQVQEHIEEQYCRQLKAAPFDPKKSYAGEFKTGKDEGAPGELGGTVSLLMRGVCTECCYRSGNMGIEGGNPNVCTQPKCFEAKTHAVWLERSQKALASGQKRVKFHEASNSHRNYDAENAKRKGQVAVTRKAVEKVWPQVNAKLKTVTALEAWRLMVRWIQKNEGYGLRKVQFDKLNEAECREWLLEMLYCADVENATDYNGGVAEEFELICATVNVDIKGTLAAVKKEAAEAEKAKSAKGGGKTKK